MLAPIYTISPYLIATIKRVTLLVPTLNQEPVADVVLAELQPEATAVSAFASTNVEGNPLPFPEVRQ